MTSRQALRDDATGRGAQAGEDQPRVILLTEDDALVGLDVREALEVAGYRVAGPFGREADALFWLAHETPDLGVLDLMLRDGPSQALAHALRCLHVPFVVYSGRRPGESGTQAFEGALWLDKPAPSTAVVACVKQLTPTSSAR